MIGFYMGITLATREMHRQFPDFAESDRAMIQGNYKRLLERMVSEGKSEEEIAFTKREVGGIVQLMIGQ